MKETAQVNRVYPSGRAYYTHKQRCQCYQRTTGSKQTVNLVARSGSFMRSLRLSLSNYSRSHTHTHICCLGGGVT